MRRFIPLAIVASLGILVGCNSDSKSDSKSGTSNIEGATKNYSSDSGPSKNNPIDPTKIPKNASTNDPKPDDSKLGIVKGGNGSTYEIKLSAPVGMTRTYTFQDETFIDPSKLKSDDPMRKSAPEYSTLKAAGEVVLVVKSIKDGITEIENSTKITSAVGTGAWKAQAADMMKNQQPVHSFYWDSSMKNVKGSAAEENLDPLTNTMNGMLPKGPFKIGSTWEFRPLSNAKVNSKVTAVSTEKINGLDTIKFKIEQPVDNPGDVFDFFVWLEIKTGMQVKSELHMYGNLKGLISKNDFVQVMK